MTLQSFDPFNSGKLVLFQVQSVGQVWRTFELIPWVFVGLCGGLFGATFIRASVLPTPHATFSELTLLSGTSLLPLNSNIEYAKIRRSSGLADHPIKEVLAVAGFTALVSYLLLITRSVVV
jgi:chloride channel 3/4/5